MTACRPGWLRECDWRSGVMPNRADWRGRRCLGEGLQAVHRDKRAEHAVMRDALWVTPRPHASAIEDRRDVIFIVALVESDDQQAIVRLRPLGVVAQMNLEPAVAGAHSSVVHVVVEVGNDEAHGR